LDALHLEQRKEREETEKRIKGLVNEVGFLVTVALQMS